MKNTFEGLWFKIQERTNYANIAVLGPGGEDVWLEVRTDNPCKVYCYAEEESWRPLSRPSLFVDARNKWPETPLFGAAN